MPRIYEAAERLQRCGEWLDLRGELSDGGETVDYPVEYDLAIVGLTLQELEQLAEVKDKIYGMGATEGRNLLEDMFFRGFLLGSFVRLEPRDREVQTPCMA